MLLGDAVYRRALPTDLAEAMELLESEGLETEFKYNEFTVATSRDRLVACVRLKPLRDGTMELASVAVAKEYRGRGIGERIVSEALEGAGGTVYALALAPGFFEKQGFRRIDAVPPALKRKAESHCASKGFVPMALEP